MKNTPKVEFPSVTLRAAAIMRDSVIWDNHACMPLRLDAHEFLPQLERHRRSGATVVSLNVYCGESPWQDAFTMLAVYRSWITCRPAEYRLVEAVQDIHAAKQAGQLAIIFDVEGGGAVQQHPGLVELHYRLGVRWMLLTYNRTNELGGGCQDQDAGLTDQGRRVIDEMERVGMVVCCSHAGYRTAAEVMEYATKPVIFSHSNARALCDHPRNIPDALIRLCARSGGVIHINGIAMFLASKAAPVVHSVLDHIDYIADLVGPEHVGLGLDYVFDQQELHSFVRARPDIFPPQFGYGAPIAMVEPECIPLIVEGLLDRGYSDEHVTGIIGHNTLRLANRVWK